jgi:hypothetical protein
MGDWLGTGAVAKQLREYRSFHSARAYARSLGFQSREEWKAFTRSGKKPDDLPADPSKTYRAKGWNGMGDWLGTGTVATFRREYRSFDRARTFSRSLGFRNREEWKAFARSRKRPDDIPAVPNGTYREEWRSWGDWLGTGTVAPGLKTFRSFKEARAYARSLGLQRQVEWFAFVRSGKKPVDIPANPQATLRAKGWVNWRDWLGTGNKRGGRKQRG